MIGGNLDKHEDIYISSLLWGSDRPKLLYVCRSIPRRIDLHTIHSAFFKFTVSWCSWSQLKKELKSEESFVLITSKRRSEKKITTSSAYNKTSRVFTVCISLIYKWNNNSAKPGAWAVAHLVTLVIQPWGLTHTTGSVLPQIGIFTFSYILGKNGTLLNAAFKISENFTTLFTAFFFLIYF